MQYYRCKCGKKELVGSYGPSDCEGCSECNTTLAQHPDYHDIPKEHEWYTMYDQNTGLPYERCKKCSAKKEK